ncbi:hypothetical protein Brms1b_002301 [Colletotrichum noveboracense]|nr:hypothetical protein COL940_003102 [Colletotrichum noveboracense]KAJ0292289.1 hypothetical protein CBS470a_002978 [Colletotrichum nupharicola]KAJ0322087.1 hypothetical protein Brms1b_002301 [Colletotrichum noveboracense]
MNGLGIMNMDMNAHGAAVARPSPSMPNLRVTHADALAQGCDRKDCFHDAASPDCELHGNLVRDIIRSRREERRARLQQRCRTQSSEALAMSAAAAAVSATRNVTPLRRQLSQSSTKSESPRSTISSDFSPCVSPLMEDLMLEVTDAIESSGTPREVTMLPQRRTAYDMDEIYRLIDEAQREYECLAQPPIANARFDATAQPGWMREDCWGSLTDHS